jgi:signal transduction histidine kinase
MMIDEKWKKERAMICEKAAKLSESEPLHVFQEWHETSGDKQLFKITIRLIGIDDAGEKRFSATIDEITLEFTSNLRISVLQSIFSSSTLYIGVYNVVDDINGKQDLEIMVLNPISVKIYTGLIPGLTEDKVLSKRLVRDLGFPEKDIMDTIDRQKESYKNNTTITYSYPSGPNGEMMLISLHSVNKRTFVLLGQDVTAQHKLQKEIEEKSIELESAIKVKSQFLATMSHEIRTPLFGIVGTLDLLTSDDELDSNLQEMVRIGTVCSQQLLVVINDILDYSKMEENKMEIENAPFSAIQLIQDSLEVVAVNVNRIAVDFIYDMNNSIACHIEEDDGRYAEIEETMKKYKVLPYIPDLVQGDAIRVRQVLVNLLSNASKFSKGNIIVRMECREYIDDDSSNTELSNNDNNRNSNDNENKKKEVLGDSSEMELKEGKEILIHISVEDFGIGISKEAGNRLFHSFSQADSSTTRQYGGSGLGLSISRRLCILMGGNTWFHSIPNQGSVFHFTFKTSMNSIYRIPTCMMKDMTVAVYIDNRVIVQMTEKALNEQGYKCVLPSPGQSAMNFLYELCTSQAPNILVINQEELISTDISRSLTPMIEHYKIDTIILGKKNSTCGKISGEKMKYLQRPLRIPQLLDAIKDINMSDNNPKISRKRKDELRQSGGDLDKITVSVVYVTCVMYITCH